VLPQIDIELSESKYHGLLGQDMISVFNKMVLNFKSMYAAFE
jgi:hypothetical protein